MVNLLRTIWWSTKRLSSKKPKPRQMTQDRWCARSTYQSSTISFSRRILAILGLARPHRSIQAATRVWCATKTSISLTMALLLVPYEAVVRVSMTWASAKVSTIAWRLSKRKRLWSNWSRKHPKLVTWATLAHRKVEITVRVLMARSSLHKAKLAWSRATKMAPILTTRSMKTGSWRPCTRGLPGASLETRLTTRPSKNPKQASELPMFSRRKESS